MKCVHISRIKKEINVLLGVIGAIHFVSIFGEGSKEIQSKVTLYEKSAEIQ